MLRKIVRVVAVLFLIAGIAIGALASHTYLPPSDEEKFYEQKHQEAIEKLQKAEAAKGTSAEARLAKEAREATESAETWGRGYRQRANSNLLGLLSGGGVALLSAIVLALTFIEHGRNAGRSLERSRHNQFQNLN